MLIFVVVTLALIALYFTGLWFMFEKAGEKGWKAIVPFYNSYIEYELVWGSGWLFLFMLVPFAGLVFSAITFYKLGRVYGKGRLFCIGVILLPFIFVPIIGFGKSRYCGVLGTKPGKYLIISGIIGFLILVLETVLTFYVRNVFNNYNYDYDYTEEIDSVNDFSNIMQEVSDGIDPSSYERRGKILTDIYDDTLQVEVPLMYMEGMDMDSIEAYTDRVDYRPDSSIVVSISVSQRGEDIESLLESCVADFKNETIINNPAATGEYSDVKVSEISRKDNSVCQQVSSVYSSDYGKYPKVDIAKVENIDGLPIIYRLSIDYYNLIDYIHDTPKSDVINATKTWNSLLDMYGIGIREV